MDSYSGLQDANISLCIEVIETIWHHQKKGKNISETELVEFVGKGKGYIKRSLNLLLLLGVIETNELGVSVTPTAYGKIHGDPQEIRSIIRSRIIRVKPFNEYCNLLSKGKKRADASKLICSLYSLKQSISSVQKLFDGWIRVFDIEVQNQPEDIDIEALEIEFASEVTITRFLVNLLGEDYKHLNEKSIEDFIAALRSYKSNPKQAVNDTGRALEDFLRIDIAGAETDVSGCNGIIQIAGTLKGAEKITSKHNGILQALGNIRTMGDAHGVDKKHMERWVIQPSSALVYCKGVLLFIKSALAYHLRKELVY